MTDYQDDEYQDDLGPSKSQLKREMLALQEVGRRMLDLSDEQLDSLPISDRLRAAVVESRRIRKHEARRRHLHYIGKVLRSEEDPEAIERGLDAFDARQRPNTPGATIWRNAGGNVWSPKATRRWPSSSTIARRRTFST